MDARLQRRVQRYGWDLAVADYEPLWRAPLAAAQAQLMACAALAPGESVLDVACGTGLIAFEAAQAVGPQGKVLGVDLSGQMIEHASLQARQRQVGNVSFVRRDAEQLGLPDASVDVALCALGLMYMPDPAQAVREMRRVLRPGGRMVIAVWGKRSRCGWAELFPIVDAEVASEVCPLFFQLGQEDALAQLCLAEQFEDVVQHRLTATLDYADADAACKAAFVGGPVALAWSRFDDEVKARVCARYVESISAWRHEQGFHVPGEFVIVAATVPREPNAIRNATKAADA